MKATSWLRTTCMVLVALLAGLVSVGSVAAADPVEIDAKRVREMMDGGQTVVIFPLSPVEFNNLHIVDSINIPMVRIPADLPADKNQAMVFYCLGRT